MCRQLCLCLKFLKLNIFFGSAVLFIFIFDILKLGKLKGSVPDLFELLLIAHLFLRQVWRREKPPEFSHRSLHRAQISQIHQQHFSVQCVNGFAQKFFWSFVNYKQEIPQYWVPI